ncbi:TPA: hypothetical protein JTJ42_003017 [Escherichia coli]|nr:hypothetical protein [Escherichia coli]HAX8525699.1 hypothetical protein [Escherichia coli]
MLRLCGVFIPDVFLLWFQNGEVRGPRVSVGGAFRFSGAALAAASEGLFVFVHSGFRDKDFPCGEATQGIK